MTNAVNLFAIALGLTSDQVDELFKTANSLEI